MTEISREGRFAVDSALHLVEWDHGAATLLELPERQVLGRACHEVLEGRDDFGRQVCGPSCPALRALQLGHITGSASIVARSPGGQRLSLRCELTALPALPGGALGRISRRDGIPSNALAHDLAATTTLTGNLSRASLREGAEQALDFLLETAAADTAELFLTEPEDEGVVLVCHRGRFRRAFAEILRFKSGSGFPGLTLAGGTPIYTDHLSDDPRFLRTTVKRLGLRTYLSAPLPGRTTVVGSIGLAFRRADVDVNRTLNLLHWVSAPLGLLVDTEVSRVREGVISASHRSGGDPEHHFRSTLDSVLSDMVQLGGFTGGELYVLGESSLARWQTHGLRPVPHCPVLDQTGSPSACPAFTENRALVLRGGRSSWPAPCRQAQQAGGQWTCLPLVAQGEPVGVVRLLSHGPNTPVSMQYLALLEHAASAMAEVVHSLRDGLERARRSDAALHKWLQHETSAPGRVSGPAAEAAELGVSHAEESSEVIPLQIRCLGTFELIVQGRAITPAMVHRRRVLTLLHVLIANHGRPQPKDVLIEALWPDANPDTRTNQFYVLVHELRQLVEPGQQRGGWTFIRNDGDRYYFNPTPRCQIDVVEFRKLISLGRRAEAARDDEAAMAAYERAAELYRGDFLDEEPFAEWCWQEREQLKENCLEALRGLAALLGKENRWDRSISHLRYALLLDPYREEVHRELMNALWAAGRRDEAVRQYEVCAGALWEELGLEPLPETKALVQRIRASPRPP